ncbi:hypothetical protein [Bacillus sp. FJAT-47783]|uniref:hypothetical protein n=1 Tax=Bacillus sp. FJAT-47783 TaxID=2922712 RepID=UPI001FAB923E|nr:hypothetical protein [Bacillus sp. FJAT-47783]
MSIVHDQIIQALETMRTDEEDLDAMLLTVLRKFTKQQLVHELQAMTDEQLHVLLLPYLKERADELLLQFENV